MAIFKYDASVFMTDKEIKALSEEKRPTRVEKPQILDLDKDEKVVLDKDNMKVQEIQAEQEKLS
jgi:hypothetical protein